MNIISLIIYFHFIILILVNIKLSNSIPQIQNNNNNFKLKELLNDNNNSQIFYKRKLSNDFCYIKNCLLCENRNECKKCKEGYELVDQRCFSKNCEIFGFCKYCDDYDCLKCIKGYKLNYGICDKKVRSKKIIILKISIIVIILFLLIYLYIYIKKKAKEKIETGQVIKFQRPKSGFYQIKFDKLNTENGIQDVSQNKSLSSSASDSGGEKDLQTPEVNFCVVCGNKKTYTIADCGCSLCLDDYKIIKGGKEKLKCRIHNILLSSNISFEMTKTHIKGNAVEKLGLPKCPICKINDGTQSFNCGCPMRVCEKCFNDNVYVLKYNQCPGCGMPYVPLKIIKKRKKSQEEKINK